MARRNRERRRPRRKSPIERKPIILVLTEGKVTEPEYLAGFAETTRNPRVRIEVVPAAGAPKTIVETAKDRKKEAEQRARRERDRNLCYDQVWCVFDVDDHPNIPDAKQMARDSGLEVALSNPCFELWLYLHFVDSPGLQPRDGMRRKLKAHIPDYDKHVDYVRYAGGYGDAVKRASRLDAQAKVDNDEGRNPTTGVWRLTESIREGS